MHIMQSPPNAEAIIDGKKYFYFVGTGYFGLHGNPQLIEAACEATRKYGIGSATSRSGFGENPPLLEVERRAAGFFGCDDAFYFVSGYCGNTVLVQCLGDIYDVLFVDEVAHYSVYDAVCQSAKRYYPFRHCDPADLAAKLEDNLRPGERPMVISDGIFPISGAIPPVPAYLEVLSAYEGASICLDDAHATGVIGPNGRGTYEHFGLQGDNLHFSGTLSKAFGGHGGIIVGSRDYIALIKARSRLFNGATPPPVPAAAATAKALELVSNDPGIKTRLWDNVLLVKRELRKLGFELDDTPVPIICLEIGRAAEMERIHQELMQRGIAIAYTKSYSGVGEEGALRIAIFSTHTQEMLHKLLRELGKLL
ncbi:MAG TPA: aminotransferase class I/II-fold pyridoxal phosphate-dependent enzyme [Acidobacteriota bacterium]|nr:aminotransferase class I/II-fold pyridoxal phosphate-dependent enzyme [Acidobacteriota bacterium]